MILYNNNLVLQNNGDPRTGGTIEVFGKNAANRYRQVAILGPRHGVLVGSPAISGRTLLVGGLKPYNFEAQPANHVFVYELPESFTPATTRQFTFESGSFGDWTPSAGSNFQVVNTGANRVLRQSSQSGDALAVLSGPESAEQAIEADITPTAFNGTDRWTGVAVRHVDASNYYYVTLRNTGVVELRRKLNGVVTTLNARNLPITAGQTYRVRLQAFGDSIDATVDDSIRLVAYDDTIGPGRAALLSYRASTEYDNVFVADVGRTPLFESLDGCVGNLHWRASGGAWECQPQVSLAQTSVSGDARLIFEGRSEDATVHVRARATGFSSAGSDPWFGIATRYRDSRNYYYLTVRSSGQVSLRKLNNGAITVLATRTFSSPIGTWLDLRLDAVGNQLRGYVNGKLMVQATDGTHTEGSIGFVTYRASAEYTALTAYQP